MTTQTPAGAGKEKDEMNLDESKRGKPASMWDVFDVQQQINDDIEEWMQERGYTGMEKAHSIADLLVLIEKQSADSERKKIGRRLIES